MNTKKKTRRILSILLSLMLVVGLMPAMSMTAFADDTRTKVTSISASSSFAEPAFLTDVSKTISFNTASEGGVTFCNGGWQKWNGNGWDYVNKGAITEGKWRYSVQARIDCNNGNYGLNYVLDNSVTLSVNNVQWEKKPQNSANPDSFLLVGNTYSSACFTSPVFTVTKPTVGMDMNFGSLEIPKTTVGVPMEEIDASEYVYSPYPPFTFSKEKGPDWINVSSNGVISGTPTEANIWYTPLSIKVKDSAGNTREASINVRETIGNPSYRIPISKVIATTPDFTPVYGEKAGDFGPSMTIKEGAPAYFNTNNYAGNWEKLNEYGVWWPVNDSEIITEGKYRYSAQLRVDGNGGKTHVLSENVTAEVNGENWIINDKAVVIITDEYSYVSFKSPTFTVTAPDVISGDVTISKAYYNDPANPVLSDNLQTMNKNGKLSFQWQRSSDGTSSWKDISGATNAAYYPGTGDVGKYIRVVITADGYISSVISNGIEVKQALINFTKPVKPTLSYSTSNGLVVTNAKANQEYLVTYSNKEPSSWSSAVKPSADGTLKLNAGGNTVAYVHTRVAETAYRPAGMYTDYSTIYTGTAVNLVSFELNYSKVSVKAGKCVKLTATPVPAGATTWKTDPGVQWYVNSSNAKLYKDAACTQEYDRSSDGYCESVYLKGINQSSWITVGAERTISGGIPTTGQMYVAVTDADGNYVLERLALPDVTLAPGESATVDISSYPDPSKIDGKMTFEAYSSNPGSKLTLTPLENNTKLRIDVPADAKTGSYGYDVKLDGTSINKNVWTISVAEKSVPVESVSVTPATVTLAPGSSLNLNAVVSPSNATEDKTVTWSRSSGSSKISVDSKGKVTVAADAPEGVTAVIKAEAGGKSATCTVKVAVPEYEILTIDGKAYSEGKTVTAAKAGTIVNLVANDAPSGKVFDKWEVVTGDIAIADLNSASTSFVMPNDDVMVKAAYKDSSLSDYKTASIRLSTTKYTYNGSVKKPTVKVVDAEGNTIPSGDYTVSYASGRKNVGRYKVTVTFKDASKKYTYFYINPKGTSISKVSGAKKAFTVKWKKQSSKMAVSTITGYQIRYSTSSKMTNARTKTVKGYKSTSKKITGLSAGKKYYVQVRTYKTVNGKTYYSSWSSVKSVKTK